MVPNLELGDMVLIRNGQGFYFDDLEIGDIIVFHSDDAGGRTIIHRVVEMYSSEDNQRILKTKGDANTESFEGLDYPIYEEDYHGKIISIIPKIGLIKFAGQQQ